MAYVKKAIIFPRAIETEEYHTGRYGAPGQKRQKKKKQTPEQVAKNNQREKEKNARHKLRQHFEENDYLVTLTYDIKQRPDSMEKAKKDFQKLTRYLRREYRKRGYELKWIRNIEVGSRGAWHVHMVINRIPDTDIIIRKAWTKGRVICQLLYERGEFRELAAYLTKTPLTDSRLVDASYSTSRNLPVPEPIKKIYNRWKTWKDNPRVPKGWQLDKESMVEGINPFTGYKYRAYTLLKVRRE